MADQAQDGLLREIDEELRQEHYAKLWKKYGNYVIALAVVVVASVVGYQGWIAYDRDARQKQAAAFAEAQRLADSDRTAQAAQSFAALADDARAGYALLARFQEAGLMARQDQRADAAVIYREIADDTSVAGYYRDLAMVLGAMIEIESGAPQVLGDRLEPILATDNPWRHNAREVLAIAALAAGDNTAAREHYKALSEDATVPAGIRGRADELLSVLGD